MHKITVLKKTIENLEYDLRTLEDRTEELENAAREQ